MVKNTLKNARVQVLSCWSASGKCVIYCETFFGSDKRKNRVL